MSVEVERTTYKGHVIEIKKVEPVWYGVATVGGGYDYWIDGVNETIKLCASASEAEQRAKEYIDGWLDT